MRQWFAVKYDGRTVRKFLTDVEAQAFRDDYFPEGVRELLEIGQVWTDEREDAR